MYLPQVRLEARDGELHVTKSAVLLKYTNGLDSTQKGNIEGLDNLGDNMTVLYENSLTAVIKASFHVSALFCKSWTSLSHCLN